MVHVPTNDSIVADSYNGRHEPGDHNDHVIYREKPKEESDEEEIDEEENDVSIDDNTDEYAKCTLVNDDDEHEFIEVPAVLQPIDNILKKCKKCNIMRSELVFIGKNNRIYKTCSLCRRRDTLGRREKGVPIGNKGIRSKTLNKMFKIAEDDTILCNCGSVLKRNSRYTHLKTKKHLEYLNFKKDLVEV